ncbi:MAG: hypothetical protein NTW97_03820 [Candidatus Krumholzibacteria bacterium]|nr:hypothetical protein [Candidatus Krumholzibacteria bacterium]
MQIDMQLLENLTLLVSRRAYREALAEIEGRGFLQPDGLQTVSNQAPLALLIADICYRNQRFPESEECLRLLKEHFPDLVNDIRYIELKSNLLIKRRGIDEALELLEGAIKRNWSENQHNLILYLLGVVRLSSGDYIIANRYRKNPSDARRSCLSEGHV